ncbi:hypothetical protein N7491_006336 [Penicillium cf. griseofulvum]|uniref:Uncharacterized protein n=1 Tax=Penicillium cf. griseofulvum TaxID=2972120 RepID=A0A9W9IWV3_9EURO|nr:hypothetical protein N7472_010633 [Penicillium cf. griseofulvum]KAJ5429320.1 hypothetical protein N7491_006336 [Penicillium cf. griseofulvum]KAJ5436902.1 hypothetical protein N7445_007787 [Penicillium cf. griseofulvum]
MKFSVIVIFGLLGLVASSPSSSRPEKRELGYDVGECNGTSCYRNLVNHRCGVGSCVGKGGGDGAKCHLQKNSGAIFCPVGCKDSHGLCP